MLASFATWMQWYNGFSRLIMAIFVCVPTCVLITSWSDEWFEGSPFTVLINHSDGKLSLMKPAMHVYCNFPCWRSPILAALYISGVRKFHSCIAVILGVLSFAKTLNTSNYSYHWHYQVLAIFCVILNKLNKLLVTQNTLSCYWWLSRIKMHLKHGETMVWQV